MRYYTIIIDTKQLAKEFTLLFNIILVIIVMRHNFYYNEGYTIADHRRILNEDVYAMQVNEKDIARLAFVSRLNLAEEDQAACAKSLNAILGCLSVLKELDTGAVEPAAHVLPLKNVFREDAPRPGLDRELALVNAPEIEDGAFVVPRIV